MGLKSRSSTVGGAGAGMVIESVCVSNSGLGGLGGADGDAELSRVSLQVLVSDLGH